MEQRPDTLEWIAFGTGLLWLGAAALFAWWNRAGEPHQFRRVPLTALAFVCGTAAVVLAMGAFTGDLGEAIPWVIGGGLLLGVAAFLSTLLVDLGATMLDAARTPAWLAGGMIMAILVTYCWLQVLMRMAGGGPSLWLLAGSPVFYTPALIAAAAGLVWWSGLPRPEGEAA